MATAKFTVQRGKVQLKDVVQTAGAAEAQSDTISLNIDYTVAKRSEILMMLQAIEQKIIQGKYPF